MKNGEISYCVICGDPLDVWGSVCLACETDMEWVSVKERLPDIGTPVIAAKYFRESNEWWFGCCIYREYGFPWVQLNNPNPVEYWMELPEPPRKESQ